MFRQKTVSVVIYVNNGSIDRGVKKGVCVGSWPLVRRLEGRYRHDEASYVGTDIKLVTYTDDCTLQISGNGTKNM